MSITRITTGRLVWQSDSDSFVALSATGEYRITCWAYPEGDEYIVTYRHRLWDKNDGRARVGEYDTLADAKSAAMAFEVAQHNAALERA